MSSAFDVLEERGFVAQSTHETLPALMAGGSLTAYIGFDPTAESLHLGHLVPIMGASHLQRLGHRVLIVVGGATGMIGDPSGRSDERSFLTPEQIQCNVRGIRSQLSQFLSFDGDNAAVMLDNSDWISRMSFTDWLREVGKYFTISYMLAKESVKERLNSDQGISFTEFSYMTMQAYDFLYLFDNYSCLLQCGGNDQWGNITAGIELIRKLRSKVAYGLTFPLVTTSSGEKFGKSAGNAIWLSAERTSPWEMYQYLVGQSDSDVMVFLKLYTFLPMERIRELEDATVRAPQDREAQKTLALEVTGLVHGNEVAREVARAADVVFYSEIADLTDGTLAAAFADAPSIDVPRKELDDGISLSDLLTRSTLVKSKSQVRRLLESGGVYVNNVRQSEELKLTLAHLASPSFIVLRIGKKNYCLVHLV